MGSIVKYRGGLAIDIDKVNGTGNIVVIMFTRQHLGK
jgi:hypothetical protein